MQNPHKILDSKTFDFSNSVVIKPPWEEPKNKEVFNKITKVVIDSRDRNRDSYPNPNYYVIEVENEIEEVTTGEVSLFDVPLARYMIHSFNNKFTINSSYEYAIPEGNYDATSITSTLSTLIAPRQITATYDSIKDKISFVSLNNEPFTLQFSSESLARMLGYASRAIVYNSDSLFTVTSPYRLNLSEDHYIIMYVDMMTINNSINSTINQSTAIIGKGDIYLNMRNLTLPIKKTFNPPIARLTKLRIRMTDYYGNPYDFQNQDHRLEFMFESRKQLSRYTSFV
jgi:hypothetical protein